MSDEGTPPLKKHSDVSHDNPPLLLMIRQQIISAFEAAGLQYTGGGMGVSCADCNFQIPLSVDIALADANLNETDEGTSGRTRANSTSPIVKVFRTGQP